MAKAITNANDVTHTNDRSTSSNADNTDNANDIPSSSTHDVPSSSPNDKSIRHSCHGSKHRHSTSKNLKRGSK
jgi:hypothetical protein